jgi:hypothetical protein
MSKTIHRHAIALALAATFLLASIGASAADIYVNGKQIRGITDLTIENCTVTFNARGDVYISAPDMDVLPTAAQGQQAKSTDLTKPQGSFLRHRYFLFTQATSPGAVPFKFTVQVNGKVVKEITAEQTQTTVELTLHLDKGSNRLEIISSYLPSKSGSSADSFSIFVGRGSPNSGSLEINKVLLNYTRKGNDSGDASDAFQIDAE